MSADFISSVTDAVTAEIATWQTRPLERVYPVIFFRKIIKTRGHFPNDDAATKLIWLALRNITCRSRGRTEGATALAVEDRKLIHRRPPRWRRATMPH